MNRRKFTSKFKTKVVLEALKECSTVQELAKKHTLHPNQISKWKAEFLDGVQTVFDNKSKSVDTEQKTEKLYKVIGEQQVEIDFLNNALQ